VIWGDYQGQWWRRFSADKGRPPQDDSVIFDLGRERPRQDDNALGEAWESLVFFGLETD
jgi:hypothetical protein